VRPSPPTTASRSLLRHRDFMKLWTGETISQFGTQISLLAIPFVALDILKATPFQYGLLATVEFLPFIILSLPAGAWVDRLRRRPILIAGDLGRVISLASIPIAYELGVLSIPQLYLVGFANGVMTVFFDVAYQSYLPSLVDRDQIVDGNSKLEISRSAAQIAGPGLAGVLIGIVSAPIAIIGDALSFLASAIAVLWIRKPEPPVDRHVDEHGRPRQGLRREVASGLRYVLGHAYLRPIAASTGWSNLFSNLGFVALFPYMLNVLGLGPGQVGVIFAVGNLGALAGAFLARRIADRVGLGRTIIAAMALNGPAFLLVAVATPELAIPLLTAAMALETIGGMVYNINQVSFRQAITPTHMQGRMNATMRFIVWGTIPVGSIVGGFLGGAIGLHPTIWVAAVGSFLAFVPLLIGPLKALRVMPEPVGGETVPTVPDAILVGEALDETPEVMGTTPLPRPDTE
jgi:MFS family permease